jgi:NADH dehydrogenase
LATAKALKNTPAEIILTDRTKPPPVPAAALSGGNFGAVSWADWFSPRRDSSQSEEHHGDLGRSYRSGQDQKCIFVSDADREGVPITYDYLILATGTTHSSFGHNEFEKFAPGLKSLADAVAIRNKILQAFEQAEAEEGP